MVSSTIRVTRKGRTASKWTVKRVLAVCLLASLFVNVVLLRTRQDPAPRLIVVPPPTPAIPIETPPAPAPAVVEGSPSITLPSQDAAARAARPSVSLIASPGYASPGSPITILCTVHAGRALGRDWIGLYAPDSDVTKYLDYRMVAAGTSSYTFKAPSKPGPLEARYILDDDRTCVATSNAVIILGDAFPSSRPQVLLSSLTLTVRRGGEIPSTWTHLSGRPSPSDWIGLYEPGAKNGNYLSWKYVTDMGQATLTAPDKPGVYELRYLLDNGYESVAVGPRIVVVE